MATKMSKSVRATLTELVEGIIEETEVWDATEYRDIPISKLRKALDFLKTKG
jgi:hypothetical protein